jgi:hypothetical protein
MASIKLMWYTHAHTHNVRCHRSQTKKQKLMYDAEIRDD